MKVKVICFLMLLSLVGSVCYAEDTVTIGSEPTSSGPAAVVVEALEDMSRETYTDYVESILDWLSPGDLITMRADALHSYFSISEDRFFFETETLSDEKRQALSDVLLSLYDAVTQYGTRVENEDKILEIGRSIGNSSECENVLSISFTDSATGERVKWDVTDEGAFVPWGYYETDKADKIIAAVENAVLAHKEVLLNYRVSSNLSNVDLSSDNVEVIERLTFEIPLNLLNSDIAKELELSSSFTRNDMVYIVYRSLMTKTASGDILADILVEKAVISEEEAEEFDVYGSADNIDELLDKLLN